VQSSDARAFFMGKSVFVIQTFPLAVGTFRADTLENKMFKKIWLSIRDALIAPEFRCDDVENCFKDVKC
jgi:hypothetical protein